MKCSFRYLLLLILFIFITIFSLNARLGDKYTEKEKKALAKAYYEVGVKYRDLKKYKNAKEAFEMVIELLPKSEIASKANKQYKELESK